MTAVVHLVRHANGTAPFEAFLDSYAKHDAGHEHELVLLWKGFPSPAELEPYRRLAPEGAREVEVDDSGRDVQAFITAAGRLEDDRICFLNSFATIEARGWLGHLSSALDQPRAGIAGASGSWGSHRSFALLQLGLPSPYRELLSNREAFAEAFRTADPAGELGLARRLTKAAVDVPRAIRGYDSFPSPHVRTNAFLIERQLLLEVAPRGAGGRSASYRFESGQRGLTRRVLARGLRTLVVARDGQAREHTEWAEADVFWQGDQSDLLVADNQTRIYQRAKPESRLMLARYAWGDQARSGRLP